MTNIHEVKSTKSDIDSTKEIQNTPLNSGSVSFSIQNSKIENATNTKEQKHTTPCSLNIVLNTIKVNGLDKVDQKLVSSGCPKNCDIKFLDKFTWKS